MNFKEAYKALRNGEAIANSDHPNDCYVWDNNTMRFISGTGISYRVQDMLDFGRFLDMIVKDNWFIYKE